MDSLKKDLAGGSRGGMDNIDFNRKERTYPIQVFKDDRGNEATEGNENETDFLSLELVFNPKNIWGNFQNSNPFKINYEIHNK